MRIKNIIIISWTALALGLSSCSDFFEINSNDMLLEKNNYATVSEVYSNFLGLAATFQAAADKYIVLSELKGDLVQPTAKAPVEYWDIFRFKAGNGNIEINPAPFYKIVVNANDFLRHIVAFNKKNPTALSDNMYKGLVINAITYRAWAYLTIGKLYGKAVYYDIALGDSQDLGKERMLEFDELINELIYFVKTGVDGVNGYSTNYVLDWTVFLNVADYTWNRLAVSVNALMTELYLWNGNYIESIRQGMDCICKEANSGGASADIAKHKLAASPYGSGNWTVIFSNTIATSEMITAVPYNYSKNQPNPLFDVFMAKLYLAPHPDLIAKYEADSSFVGGKKVPGDQFRGKGVTYTGGRINAESINVVMRYFSYNTVTPIYRAADIFLMMTEALNYIGDLAAADSLLNVGTKTSFVSPNSYKAPFNSPIFLGVNGTDMQNSLGVRGRAGVVPRYLKYFVKSTTPLERKQFVMDSLIGEEVALESAYEGKRWFTLLRMARNSNMPEKLAIPISKKFPAAEQDYYRNFLMNPKNWFFEYDQLNMK